MTDASLLGMKKWFSLALFLISAGLASGQMPPMQMPKTVTWVEESSHKNARGEISRTCSAISKSGSDWRSESTNQQADMVISICKDGKVFSSQSPAPSASPGPVASVEGIYESLTKKAKFEMVDVYGGVGLSRFRETGTDGSVTVIWMDRTAGFPFRATVTLPDGSVREQTFKLVTVDPALQRRLFDGNSLYPVFGHYLDDWHSRVSK